MIEPKTCERMLIDSLCHSQMLFKEVWNSQEVGLDESEVICIAVLGSTYRYPDKTNSFSLAT